MKRVRPIRIRPAGFELHYEARPCLTCHGAMGYVETSTGDNGAQLDIWVPCSACNGSGVQ